MKAARKHLDALKKEASELDWDCEDGFDFKDRLEEFVGELEWKCEMAASKSEKRDFEALLEEAVKLYKKVAEQF